MNRVCVLQLVSLVSVALFFLASSSATAEGYDFDRSGKYLGGFYAASFSHFTDGSDSEFSSGVSATSSWMASARAPRSSSSPRC